MSNFLQSPFSAESRAEPTRGISNVAIYRMAILAIEKCHPGGGVLIDVGCGNGVLWQYIQNRFDTYVGADVVRYQDFPKNAAFHKVNLDTGRVDLPDKTGNVVACLETIEHVENARALVRELVRLTCPGGLVIITTPNQINLLSKLSLLVKNQFPFFAGPPGLYPSHITALLPIDLMRIAQECGLVESEIRYSNTGRVPGTQMHWPRWLRGQVFSDNVLLMARRP